MSGFVEINDMNIHYERAGHGKNVVLLLPGALGWYSSCKK